MTTRSQLAVTRKKGRAAPGCAVSALLGRCCCPRGPKARGQARPSWGLGVGNLRLGQQKEGARGCWAKQAARVRAG